MPTARPFAAPASKKQVESFLAAAAADSIRAKAPHATRAKFPVPLVMYADPAAGPVSAHHVAREEAARGGMRWLDAPALAAMRPGDVGPNDFVYLEIDAATKSTPDMAPGVPAEPGAQATMGTSAAAHLQAAARAGGALVCVKVDHGAAMPGPGLLSALRQGTVALLVEVADPTQALPQSLAAGRVLAQVPLDQDLDADVVDRLAKRRSQPGKDPSPRVPGMDGRP